jgi:hypothetical protein
MQVRLDSVLEGIRILNGRIEEYDKRIEGVQQSTNQFLSEVQAENNRRQTIICQALDSLHDKVTSEVSTKIDTIHTRSPTSVSGRYSPNIESPRTTFQPFFPTNSTHNAIQLPPQFENQAKIIDGLVVRFNTLQEQFLNFQNLNANLPARVSQFCDEITQHLRTYQAEQGLIKEKLKTLDVNYTTLGLTLNKHTQNTDSNFRETAMHMESVKKRFAEHRKQLDNLITAWRETMTTTDQLNTKYEYLKDFLSKKVIPTVSQIQDSLPSLTAGVGQGGGAASNPIELT